MQHKNRKNHLKQEQLPAKNLALPKMQQTMDTPRRPKKIRKILKNKRQELQGKTKNCWKLLHHLNTKGDHTIKRVRKRNEQDNQSNNGRTRKTFFVLQDKKAY